MRYILIWLCMLTPAHAQDDVSDYIAGNTSAIFYHELGHALIDLIDVPIFGQEEDAADVLSILMIDMLYEAETADAIAYDTAYNFQSDALDSDTNDLPYWDVHGLDLQRYYTLVCLHYGANPRTRQGFADDLELPEDRADYCEDERMQAESSWGQILDEVTEEGTQAASLVLDVRTKASNPNEAAYINTVVEDVKQMNTWLKLPEKLKIVVGTCGEANAFYDPQDVSITMCTEFANHLAAQIE